MAITSPLQALCLFFVYSFLGWGVEVAFHAVSLGKLVNRGFLNGPVCPIYGFGMLGILTLLAPLENNLFWLFLGGMAVTTTIELVGGWALYKLFHTRWWDYSDLPMNLGGYICAQFSLYWGIGTLLMIKLVHPTVLLMLHLVPGPVKMMLCFFWISVFRPARLWGWTNSCASWMTFAPACAKPAICSRRRSAPPP